MALSLEATQLQNYFLKKATESQGPLKILLAGAAMIAAVAVAVFSGLAALPAFALGLGVGMLLIGLVQIVFSRGSVSFNQGAADALNSPGFYEFFQRNYPRHLSSAEKIVEIHQRWTRN